MLEQDIKIVVEFIFGVLFSFSQLNSHESRCSRLDNASILRMDLSKAPRVLVFVRHDAITV